MISTRLLHNGIVPPHAHDLIANVLQVPPNARRIHALVRIMKQWDDADRIDFDTFKEAFHAEFSSEGISGGLLPAAWPNKLHVSYRAPLPSGDSVELFDAGALSAFFGIPLELVYSVFNAPDFASPASRHALLALVDH